MEQYADNMVKFWAKKIHSVENMVLIPWWVTWSLHGKISGYYNSVYTHVDWRRFSKFREYVKTLSFYEQKKEWMKILKKFWY